MVFLTKQKTVFLVLVGSWIFISMTIVHHQPSSKLTHNQMLQVPSILWRPKNILWDNDKDTNITEFHYSVLKHRNPLKNVKNLDEFFTGDDDNNSNLDKSKQLENVSDESPLANVEYKIFVDSIGRLGNNMFQMAAAYGIASENRRIVVASPDMQPQISFQPRIRKYFQFHFPEKIQNYVSERNAGEFSTNLFSLPDHDVRICCYFQSWKYFDKQKHTIKDMFSFRNEDLNSSKQILNQAKRKFNNLSQEQYILIGVHVRYSDMETIQHKKQGWKSAPASYINRAMNFFKNKYGNVRYIMVSDSYDWCHSQFGMNPSVYLAKPNNHLAHMALLTLCNHTIITVGTFGWWAAYLTGGDVVYYRDWMEPNSELSQIYRNEDYYPPHWIAISA